ncbi:hypothetical protein SAMN04488122_3257 [Chitinophaga arvensicola]|uniref:Uncharacterized protein n=2 Tax=Chitinophaga arvensicola TaxID=29529 RepID=A0A1I0RRD9_9BACT|nr:hypothetical protein SAMN04488122_3257 [Chitinophaga arvensicola]
MLIWLCQLSGRYVVLLDYYLNQDYIVRNFCVNRDKPAMHCNGKCHLRKQLREEERKEQENPERKTDHRSEIFYASLCGDDLREPLPVSIAGNTFYHHLPGTPIDRPSAVFRPPVA